jgi:hypothetical protein
MVLRTKMEAEALLLTPPALEREEPALTQAKTQPNNSKVSEVVQGPTARRKRGKIVDRYIRGERRKQEERQLINGS